MTPVLIVPAALLSFLAGAVLGVGRRGRQGLSMLPPGKTTVPVPGASAVAWRRFVALMVVAPKRSSGPRGRLGYFGMDARRLADVGLVERPRKTVVDGEEGVWSGSWKPPLTRDAFLGSARLQYDAFARSAGLLAPKLGPLVGSQVGSERATLSGLLGVAHLAGEKGVEGWVRSPEVRNRFRATTANFNRVNNLF